MSSRARRAKDQMQFKKNYVMVRYYKGFCQLINEAGFLTRFRLAFCVLIGRL